MNKTNRPTWIELSKKNLKHNLKMLLAINGKKKFFCPMIKANAYGHGDVFVAKTMQEMGFNALGVAMLEEGIHLRKNKIKIENILIFEPILSLEHLVVCLKYKFVPILTQWEDFPHLDQFFKKNKSAKLRVHIKFNTGMNRLGFKFKEWLAVKNKVEKYKNLIIDGVFTHIHSGEDFFSKGSKTIEQLDRLVKIQSEWLSSSSLTRKKAAKSSRQNSSFKRNIKFHAMSSVCFKAVALSGEKKYALGGRPGIAIYGIEPDLNIPAEFKSRLNNWQLKPVLSWHTKIVEIHNIKKGESVSYAARWKASQDTRIGVLPVGYADGYRRNLTNQSFVLIHDQRAPIVGTVCMDYIMVDLGSVHSECKIGDEVILLGSSGSQKVDAQEWADILKTNSYEIVTCISNRVMRIVV
jgi:alanine racemase